MTPELKKACEAVFQEHRASINGIDWKKDVFRGRISTGLSEKAKETLLSKNIIYFPNPVKKAITLLNPEVAGASTCDEAEKVLLHEIVLSPAITATVAEPTIVAAKTRRPVADNKPIPQRFVISSPATESVALIEKEKWYLRPVMVYFVWPICAAAAGGGLAYLIGAAYDYIFFK